MTHYVNSHMALKIFLKIKREKKQAFHSTYNRKERNVLMKMIVQLLQFMSPAGEVWVPLNWYVHMCHR